MVMSTTSSPLETANDHLPEDEESAVSTPSPNLEGADDMSEDGERWDRDCDLSKYDAPYWLED